MHPFVAALLGGAIIGLSASMLLLLNGRVAGISGIFGGVLAPSPSERSWRGAFVLGLILAGVAAASLSPGAFDAGPVRSVGATAAAGILVGFGTRLGNGCTSGHGICGLSRLSLRSLAAVMTFMATAGVTVYVTNHVVGGAQ
jgi:uncharacterized protein